LYLTDQTNACLFKCKFVIEERQGLSLIVGKIGYGKTSVLREFINAYIDDESLLTPEQRKGHDNAIWLCQTCGVDWSTTTRARSPRRTYSGGSWRRRRVP
jgi:hypothetical protein